MKFYFILLIHILFLISCGNSQQNVPVNGQQKFDGSITETQANLIYAESKDFPNQTQLAIAIIENGNTKFYGIRRENDTLVMVNNHESIFEIGSITKVFTATLLADLVLKQQIALGSPINSYIQFPLKDNVEITFRQLTNHTSGLPRMPTNFDAGPIDKRNPYKEYDEKKLQAYLTNELTLSQQPGEKFEYSNLGVALLGYVLAKMDTTTYEELLQTKIFSPFHMTSSTTNRKAVESKVVKGLNDKGEVTPNWDLNVFAGAGAILSSVSDLSKFAHAQFDTTNNVLALTRKPTFTNEPNKMEIGMGWIIKRTSGEKWFWHNGGTGGYRSSMMVDPENKKGVIVLSNISAFHRYEGNIDNLCNRLMETLKNK